MKDFTEEQWAELYGIKFDLEGEQHAIQDWEPDFTAWLAFWSGDDACWFITPKVFWEANKYIPDHCVMFDVPGFEESMEHALTSEDIPLNKQKQALIDLGFEVRQW